MVDAYDVVSFKLVRHSTVSKASNHGGHSCALLHEVFLADWVIKTLTHGNIAEFGTMTGGMNGHTESKQKCENYKI